MILDEDDWYNIVFTSQSQANKKYFILFQAVDNLQIRNQKN